MRALDSMTDVCPTAFFGRARAQSTAGAHSVVATTSHRPLGTLKTGASAHAERTAVTGTPFMLHAHTDLTNSVGHLLSPPMRYALFTFHFVCFARTFVSCPVPPTLCFSPQKARLP